MHRPVRDIESDIKAVQLRLNELQLERGAAIEADHEVVFRLFDAGQNARQIARELKKPLATVQGILWRSGRTEKGRTAIARQIEAHVARLGT